MAHEKAELEGEFFTGSGFHRNICGYNPNPKKIYPAVLREEKRRPTSNALDNESKESLEVVVRRFSELLTKGESHTELVLENFAKMNIESNHDLNIALSNTRDQQPLTGRNIYGAFQGSEWRSLTLKQGKIIL